MWMSLASRGPATRRAERGRSTSSDVTRTDGPLSYTATVFASRIKDSLHVERRLLRLLVDRARAPCQLSAVHAWELGGRVDPNRRPTFRYRTSRWRLHKLAGDYHDRPPSAVRADGLSAAVEPAGGTPRSTHDHGPPKACSASGRAPGACSGRGGHGLS